MIDVVNSTRTQATIDHVHRSRVSRYVASLLANGSVGSDAPHLDELAR